ncbi:MAG: hypothetical protein WBF67_06280 [Olleya sp.]
MKKSIIIICIVLVTLSVTAFTIFKKDKTEVTTTKTTALNDIAVNTPQTNKKDTEIFEDFIYDVGTRFGPIKKSDLQKVTSISDFMSQETLNSIVDLKSVRVIIVKDERQTDIQELGYTKDLTSSQLKLLQSLDYSEGFNVRAEFTVINPETGLVENNYDSPHLSVVPEKQAQYALSKDQLKKYLKDNTEAEREGVNPKKLRPAKLYFTVTKLGTIENVRLDRGSYYPKVDNKMIELIKTLPETWTPAENEKGEKVDQELVVSFGLMGC